MQAQKTRQLLDDTLKNVRRISRDLVPTTLERFGLLAALEELVGLDATYQAYAGSPNGDDDPSDDNEEVRLAAYRQRFNERKQLRDRQKVLAVDDLLNQSWGNGQCNTSEEGSVARSIIEGVQQLTYKQWQRRQQGLPVSEHNPILSRPNAELVSL